MKHAEKQEAIKLRKTGMPLHVIAKKLAVSKASVSLWVRDVFMPDGYRERLRQNMHGRDSVEKRRKSRIRNEQNKRDDLIRLAEEEISIMDDERLRLIGCSLYFAEGGKTQRGMVRFSNSNPVMIRIMMRFFREICDVQELKFKGHIHTHSVGQVGPSEKYWSKITGISTKQFFKTYHVPPKSSGQNKKNLLYGTFDIYVCDTKLFLKIQGWTQKICKLILA